MRHIPWEKRKHPSSPPRVHQHRPRDQASGLMLRASRVSCMLTGGQTWDLEQQAFPAEKAE